jgi:hypothetical protein
MYWRSPNANCDLEAKSVCSVRFHSFELEPFRARPRKMSDEEFAAILLAGYLLLLFSKHTKSMRLEN